MNDSEKAVEIRNKLNGLVNEIEEYHKHLNNTGYWLIASIVGAWGVLKGIPRAATSLAILLTFICQILSG